MNLREAPEGVPEGVPDGKAPEGAPDGKTPGGAPDGAGGAKASLGDSPLAINIYKDGSSSSPNPDFDCGLAAENMAICAASLGYGVKIVSSPTMSLNGENHDSICEKLGVDPSMQAVAVLLIGKSDSDAVSSASTREGLDVRPILQGKKKEEPPVRSNHPAGETCFTLAAVLRKTHDMA